jgi:hypothetical protein
VPEISGWDDSEVDQWALSLEPLVRKALTTAASEAVTAFIADTITAAGTPNLGSVIIRWVKSTGALVDFVAKAYAAAGDAMRGRVIDAYGLVELPAPPDLFGEEVLASARNHLEGLGNLVWEVARDQMHEGFQAGESTEQIALRLKNVADLTEARALATARTEVLSAINAGQFNQVRALGMTGTHEWLATVDPHTRPTHKAADGQKVELAAPFQVGEAFAHFPGDPALPPGERINCRCTVLFDLDEVDSEETSKFASLAAAGWDAGKHPRDKNGKFIKSGFVKKLLTEDLSPLQTNVMLMKVEKADWDTLTEKQKTKIAKQSAGTQLQGKFTKWSNEDADTQITVKNTAKKTAEMPPSKTNPDIVTDMKVGKPKKLNTKSIFVEKYADGQVVAVSSAGEVLAWDENFKKFRYQSSQGAAPTWLTKKAAYDKFKGQDNWHEQADIAGPTVPGKAIPASPAKSTDTTDFDKKLDEAFGPLPTSRPKKSAASDAHPNVGIVESLTKAANLPNPPFTDGQVVLTMPDGSTFKYDSYYGGFALYDGEDDEFILACTANQFADLVGKGVYNVNDMTVEPDAITALDEAASNTAVPDLPKVDALPEPSPAPIIDPGPAVAPGDISNLTTAQKKAIKKDLSSKKVGYWSKPEKIYDEVQLIKSNNPGMTDMQVLNALDEVTATKGSPTPFKDKMVKWLGTSKGKGYASDWQDNIDDAASGFGGTTPSAPASSAKPVVDLGGGDISGLTAKKSAVYGHFKGQSSTFVDSPATTIWAAIENTSKKHGITNLQALRLVDLAGAEKFGVENKSLFEKKIKDWLKTPEGTAHALGLPPPPIPTPGTPALHPSVDISKIGSRKDTDKYTYKNVSYNAAVKHSSKSQAQHGDLTGAQQSALRTYTGNAYHAWNAYLRGKKSELPNGMLNKIKLAQAGLRPSLEPMLLHRGVGWSAFPGVHSADQMQKLIGKKIEHKGFMSTSVGNNAAFGGDVKMQIEAPPGTPMMFVDPFSTHKGENEMVLASGLKFEIISASKTGYSTVVRVRVVSE